MDRGFRNAHSPCGRITVGEKGKNKKKKNEISRAQISWNNVCDPNVFS
jgi:hypothetical protein